MRTPLVEDTYPTRRRHLASIRVPDPLVLRVSVGACQSGPTTSTPDIEVTVSAAIAATATADAGVQATIDASIAATLTAELGTPTATLHPPLHSGPHQRSHPPLHPSPRQRSHPPPHRHPRTLPPPPLNLPPRLHPNLSACLTPSNSRPSRRSRLSTCLGPRTTPGPSARYKSLRRCPRRHSKPGCSVSGTAKRTKP